MSYEVIPTAAPAALRCLAATLATVALVGCGSADGAPDDARGTDPGASPSAATGPGLSIDEARESTLAGPLLVRGALVVDAHGARLCEQLAESHPPQCAGDRLDVIGLDAVQAGLPDLSEANGVSWSEEVKLLGRIEDDRLVVSSTAIG